MCIVSVTIYKLSKELLDGIKYIITFVVVDIKYVRYFKELQW